MPETGDDIDILTADISVRNQPGVTAGIVRNAAVTGKITASRIVGDSIITDYSHPVWPKTSDNAADAIQFFGYTLNGVTYLKKFDWVRPGQSSKSLENVHAGYDGLVMPPRGTEVFTMLSGINGRERTNIKRVVWK